MVNARMGKSRKWYSILLVFSLLFGLLTDLTIPAATAQAEEEELTGLIASDWLDYDEDGNPVKINDESDYGKGLTVYLPGGLAAIKYKDGDKTTAVEAEDLELYYGDDMSKLSDSVAYMVTEKTEEEVFVHFYFGVSGTYYLVRKDDTNKEDPIMIFVEYPNIGFYSTAEKQDESFIQPSSTFDITEDNTVYLIAGGEKGTSVDLPEEIPNDQTMENYTFAVFSLDYDGDFVFDAQELKDYFTYEKISDDMCKLVINRQAAVGGLEIYASIPFHAADGSEWNERTQICAKQITDGALMLSSDLVWSDEGLPTDVTKDSWDSYLEGVWMPWDMTVAACYTEDEDDLGNAVRLTADQLKVTDLWGNPTTDVTLMATGKDDQFISIRAEKRGNYCLVYTLENGNQVSVPFRVTLPSVGFFKDAAYTESGLLRGDSNFGGKYGKADRTFYIVTDGETKVENLSVEISSEKNGEWSTIANGAKVEPVKEGTIYRVTLADTVTGEVQALAKYTAVYNEYDSEPDASIDMLLTPKDTFDTSKTAWNYTGAFTYDGKQKTVELTNLPEGVKAVYSGNTATQPGKYTAKVTFIYDEDNYDAPDVATELTWEIKQKTVPGGSGQVSKPDTNTKVGQIKTIGVNKYKVTSVKAGKEAVEFVGCKDKKQTKVTIPAAIKLDNKTFKVTSVAANACKANKKLKQVTIGANVKSIGKNAFSGCKKLSKVTIKSKVLTKVGKGFCKNAAKKCTVKVPKKQVKAYKKLLKKAGFKKTVK